MTTTPNEPEQDPTVVPSGDPGSPSEPSDFPETDPEAEPAAESGHADEQPGQMPPSTNTEVGA